MDTVEFLRMKVPPIYWAGQYPNDVTIPVPIIHAAADELEKLRATQFRWIPVSERLPTVADGHDGIGFVLTALYGGSMGMTSWEHIGRAHYTHWAPMPPLPGKTQEEKDEELFQLWRLHDETAISRATTHTAFLAGLKAARAEK